MQQLQGSIAFSLIERIVFQSLYTLCQGCAMNDVRNVHKVSHLLRGPLAIVWLPFPTPYGQKAGHQGPNNKAIPALLCSMGSDEDYLLNGSSEVSRVSYQSQWFPSHEATCRRPAAETHGIQARPSMRGSTLSVVHRCPCRLLPAQ